MFAAPVDPNFLAAWRDYEKRYEEVMLRSWLSELVSEQDNKETNRISKSQVEWNYADEKANGQAAAIEEAIGFSQFNAEQDNRWDLSQEDYIQKVEEGMGALVAPYNLEHQYDDLNEKFYQCFHFSSFLRSYFSVEWRISCNFDFGYNSVKYLRSLGLFFDHYVIAIQRKNS